jgi:hypothetical protein
MRKTLALLLGISAATTWAQNAPTIRPWDEYRVFMWVGDSAYKQKEKLPLFWERMREMGATAAMVHGDGDIQPLLDAKMPYYVENIVNKGLCLKWSSEVRDWDKMVSSWKDKRDEAGAVRQYSFDDPKWRGWANGQMASLVKKNAPNKPLLYDIRDELSTTISANPFDYDFHPLALAGFRKWLQTQYASLEALNAQWDTKFATWDEVKPFMTDQMKNRMASGDAIPRGKPDWQAVQQIKLDAKKARSKPVAWNFSPWADHRTYMDISLAKVLGELRDTARGIDAATPVGIEGTQMPAAFGGYDLWRLSQALDWVEPYDICDAREIFGSFMPGKSILSTTGIDDPRGAQRKLWHLLLLGDRGCIVWWSEDCVDWKSPDYTLTAKAKAMGPVFKELATPLARLFLRAKREVDPIAIHYSQASVQAAWMMESTVDGSTWLRRFSSYEAAHNRHAQVRHAWLETLQDLGYSPQFVSTEQIEKGVLSGFKAVVLPQSWAVSDAESAAILGLGKKGTVLADGTPGLFDGHCRLRTAAAPFDAAFPLSEAPRASAIAPGQKEAATFSVDMVKLAKSRVGDEPQTAWYNWLASQIPFPPAIKVPASARVQTHRYKLGNARLIAFERNVSYSMTEDLKQGGGNMALEKPVTFDAELPSSSHVYELRSGKYLGQLSKIAVTIDPWQPSLYAITSTKLPEGDIIRALEN